MIVVVIGVAGSGKSTIGSRLARALGCQFLEGDTLHPRANIDKMSRGIPLDDDDRSPWLSAIHARIVEAYRRDASLGVACSALKQEYRDDLERGVAITWVYLKGSQDLLRARLQQRPSHFMKAEMLDGQVAALDEPSNVIVIDIADPPDNTNVVKVPESTRVSCCREGMLFASSRPTAAVYASPESSVFRHGGVSTK